MSSFCFWEAGTVTQDVAKNDLRVFDMLNMFLCTLETDVVPVVCDLIRQKRMSNFEASSFRHSESLVRIGSRRVAFWRRTTRWTTGRMLWVL